VAGWGGRSTDNTVLAEAIASHGFIVAALGDVSFDEPPPARLSSAPDFSSRHAYDATREIAGEKLRYEARRASAVLDRLLVMNEEADGPFQGRIDPDRIGIYGFSLGGAVSLEASRSDSRFKAAMNMDGLLFDAGYDAPPSTHAEYFLISDASTDGPSEAELTSADPIRRYSAIAEVVDAREQRKALNRGGYSLNIDGANHLSFTDAALYSPLERFREGAAPRRVATIVCKYAVAFFETSLTGRPSPLLDSQAQHDAGVVFERWPHGRNQDGND
jgi:dienelactone hydrolase